MSRSRRFAQVDVFAEQPYDGNPVAVVLDGEGLDDRTMQRFATWTNLSETTFVLPPTVARADYRLRILTPGGELPFAGHPTLGSAHAWLEAGGVPAREDAIVQECAAGLVPLRRSASGLAFRGPALVRGGPVDGALLDRIAAALRVARAELLDAQWVDNGPGWVAVRLASAQRVLDLEPDDAGLRGLMLGVVGAYPTGAAHQVEVRAFALPIGVREDPVTGSLHAGLAEWLVGTGVVPATYSAGQGARVDRRGAVAVEVGGGATWVGGACHTCVRGRVDL